MVSPMASRPEYLRIADALREQIRDGTYPSGAKLPSERELRERFAVGSAGTVRAALGQLRDEGLVVAYQGKGVFVREQPVRRKVGGDKGWRAILARTGHRDASEVTVHRVACAGKVAELLEVEAGTLVTVRERLLRAEGEPPSLISLSWHPDWIVEQIPDLADPRTGGMIGMHEQLGLRLHFHDVFSSRRPFEEERQRLQLEPGDVVTEQWGVTRDQDDRPLYAIHHVAAGHRIEFAVAYGDLPPTS
jgi:GntR family transcriptional regulator